MSMLLFSSIIFNGTELDISKTDGGSLKIVS